MAVSDPGGTLARPLEVIASEKLADLLRELFVAEPITEVLVGVPKTLKGEIGPQARRTLSRLEDLKKAFPAVRFVEWDERLTTRLVRSGSREARASSPVAKRPGGRTRRTAKRAAGEKERVDHLAAAAMLQEYLDRRGSFEAVQKGSNTKS